VLLPDPLEDILKSSRSRSLAAASLVFLLAALLSQSSLLSSAVSRGLARGFGPWNSTRFPGDTSLLIKTRSWSPRRKILAARQASLFGGCSPAVAELAALFRCIAGTCSGPWPLELDGNPRSLVLAIDGASLVAIQEDSGAHSRPQATYM